LHSFRRTKKIEPFHAMMPLTQAVDRKIQFFK
jgi:hypothetical protein